MSEPTSGDNQPDDPTAPLWADPTAPIPAPPVPPGAAPPQDQEPPAHAQGAPQAPPPMGNPYAQQPPAQPYAQQPPAQPYGQQYPAYGQQSYLSGPPTDANASAIVLTIVSGIIMLSTCFFIGIPSLVFGIMALASNSTDPTGSRKKTKTGWIIFAVNAGVVVLLAVTVIAFLVVKGNSSSDSKGSY
jgi:hypothetical protein